MMDFRDVSAEAHIKDYSAYFNNVNYPSQPLNTGNKAFFDNFFGGDGFISFCDQLFGTYYETYPDNGDGLCWMDLANASPTQSLASALMALIHPNSSFISMLEALSIPSPTFATRIQKGWKNSSDARSATFYTVDLPLSTIFPQSYQLMAEPAETNLYSLPRSRCPSVLLIPFWEPPVITRKEVSQGKVLTSLPCSPMGYFIFRSLLYGMKRVQRNCDAYLSRRKSTDIFTRLVQVKYRIYHAFFKTIPVEMPFYAQLLQTYTQIYVSGALPRHLSATQSIADVTWTTNDVVASLLVIAPALLAHRQLETPENENLRFPCTNAETLAQLLSIVPLHTSAVYAITQRNNDVTFSDNSESTPPEFPMNSASRAQTDIECIRRTLYRNCLTVLRECLLSLELHPYCRDAHFTYCLELWAVLMNSYERQPSVVPSQYIVQHFEAYSFIAIDVLNLIVKSSMIFSMTEDSARVLRKCFFLLSRDPVLNLLDEINTSSASKQCVADAVSRQFVLNWAGSDGNIQLPNLRGDTTCSLAATAYVMLEKILVSDVTEPLRTDVREVLTFIALVFPKAVTLRDTWSSSEKISRRSPVHSIPSSCTAMRQMSGTEKRLFFKGVRGNQRNIAKNLKLPTRNGRVPGGHHPALQTSLRNEIPLLIGVSQFIDAMLVKGMETYHSSAIPKCDRGHNLLLTYSKCYSCEYHSQMPAIWECAICEVVYGSCCRGLPCRADGGRLTPCTVLRTDVPQCSTCGQVVPDDSNMFTSEDDSTVYFCPDCASRPFRSFSIRWVASYRTWAAIICLFAIYCVIVLLSS